MVVGAGPDPAFAQELEPNAEHRGDMKKSSN